MAVPRIADMALIPRTDLDVFGLCLGGNVFGWTANRDESFTVLDAYSAAGGNFIDSADVYMAGAPGNSGGESETIIGEWLAAREGKRDDIVIATKVGKFPGLDNLRPETIHTAAENSLKRLGVETIDLYYAHFDDPGTPLAETLGAFGELIEAGKVRYIAASNYSAARLTEALETSEREGLPRYVALQPHYNLMERDYESEQGPVCEREDLACFPYYALAKGFLTGKYRPGGEQIDSVRAEGATEYLDERGERMLSALDEIAATHGVAPATVAVAWLREQPTVLAPIASARNEKQLEPLIASASLELSDAELSQLTAI
jgi:aryl-alcohol dehydrogenase-like predicted oxidoreductase